MRSDTRHRAPAAVVAAALALATAALVPPSASAQARDRYQAAVPSSTVRALDTALALRRQGRDDEAVRAMKKIVRSRSDYFRGWYNLGLAHLDRSELDEATAALERARAIRDEQRIPEYSVYSSLGWSYLLQDRYGPAEKNLRIAWAHKQTLPGNIQVQVLNNLGLVARNQGDYSTARTWFETAVRLYDSREAREQLHHLDELEAQLRRRKAKSASSLDVRKP